MGEQTNVALVQTIYAGFNCGDIQSILAAIDQHAEWVDYGPAAVPYFGNFTGRIADFFKAIGESTVDGRVAIDRYIASGDIVVTQGQYTATVRTSGAKIDTPIAHVFTLRDGKVTSWKGYGDTA